MLDTWHTRRPAAACRSWHKTARSLRRRRTDRTWRVMRSSAQWS